MDKDKPRVVLKPGDPGYDPFDFYGDEEEGPGK